MYQFFVEDEQLNREYVTIRGKDCHHIKDVVRLKCGDTIRVSAKSGKSYLCRIAEMTEEFVQADLLEESAETELPVNITLFQALPKGDRMETVIEKAVELGVVKIVPVRMRYCVVKLDEKKAAAKQKKWQELAESAAKQSKRSRIPEVAPVCSFADAATELKNCDLPLVPYENEEGMEGTKKALDGIRTGQTVGIMIGPEGGFAPEEVEALQKECRLISLGKRILRTDTAAITASALVMLSAENGLSVTP